MQAFSGLAEYLLPYEDELSSAELEVCQMSHPVNATPNLKVPRSDAG